VDGRLRPYAGIAELIEHDLIERGVPKDKILRVAHDADNTREEAITLAQVANKRNGAASSWLLPIFTPVAPLYFLPRLSERHKGSESLARATAILIRSAWWGKAHFRQRSVPRDRRHDGGYLGAAHWPRSD